EPLLPSAKVFRRNGEGEMQLAAAAMRRNHTAGQRHRFRSAAATKQDQDIASGNVEGAETLVGPEAAEAEQALVEMRGTREILDVNAGFEHARNAGHCFPSASEAFFDET